MIRRYGHTNIIVVANHSDRCDPLAVAALSRQTGQDFSYLAARELFDKNAGILGWIMQHCGVYSVIRGAPEDIDSKTETISLIVEADRPLVMFPEGDVTGRDGLAPFKADGIENMFEAQRLLLEFNYVPRSVVLIPVAINYVMSNSAIEALNDRIRALELKLGLPYQMSSVQVRILRIVGALVDQLECTFGTLAPTSHLNARLRHVIRHVVNTLAHLYGFKMDSSLTMTEAEMLYNVRGGLRRLKKQPWGAESFFSHRLREVNATAGESLVQPLQDLVILESSLRQADFDSLLANRLVERLELIINGHVSPKGMRTAMIDAGEPIELAEYWTEYVQSAPRAIELVARKVKASIEDTHRDMLAPIRTSPSRVSLIRA